MKIPEPTQTPGALIDTMMESVPQEFRPHLGISVIGKECARAVWYGFRFYAKENFSGRMLRLFERGQKEEDVLCSYLSRAGYQVKDRQKRVYISGHVSGSIDGIMEWQGKDHLVEFKTHNKKSFDDLEKKGVEKSKPQHYAQMQVYMMGLGLERAWYIAVCKDDDRIHSERVKLDLGQAQDLARRAVDISLAETPPEKLSNNPAWFECKFCAFHSVCHEGAPALKSCRSCVFGQIRENDWYCRHHEDVIPFDVQTTGCGEYRA